MSEHDFEPIRGLPGRLPDGERILWQGAPDWRILACQAFHIRAVGAYFAAMLVWRTGAALSHGEDLAVALRTVLLVAPVALAGLGILAFLAWLNSRTTVYTITNRRVVMRFGAALPKAINLPFTIVDGAALKSLSGRAGDLALTLKAPNKIAFLQLWPHARPWRVASPQPTLRALADAHAPAGILAGAMQRELASGLIQAEARSRASAAAGSLAGAEVQPA
jgi:hypothetical protein